MGPMSSLHCLDVTNRFTSTDSAADSFVRNKRRSRKNHPRVDSSADKSPSMQPSKEITEIARRLLSSNSSLTQRGYALRGFEQILLDAREDKILLQKLQISPVEARTMLLVPSQLLNDVHMAIIHYSKIDSFIEIDVPVNNQHDTAGNKSMGNDESMNAIKKKVPGPMVCALLLELIGIPQYYSHISTRNDSPPIMTVHSSQIDKMIECSLLTTAALSNTCRVGRNSLIGYDFNSQNINYTRAATKTAAALAEEIWRSVSNMQILYTSGNRNSDICDELVLPRVPIRIGRIGFIGEQYNPLMEYLVALREVGEEEYADEDFVNEQDTVSDVDDFDYSGDTSVVPSTSLDGNNVPWSPKDQRRYDQTLMMFNSVLDAYAKLGSSASGTRPEIRREMVMNCERLLLEVVAREKTKPSPETILQHVQPDGISFNTVMKAWAGMSPKQRVDSKDEYAKKISSATAERTEGILEMMHEYYEKERAQLDTFESIQASWRERGGSSNALGELVAAPHGIPVTPNTASYNIALNAWSKISDPDSAIKALDLFKRMVHRCNTACIAREAMIADNAEVAHGRNPRVFNALPDSRTFTALLSALSHTSSTFNEACDLVLSIFVVMKEWDDQLEWCSQNKIGPPYIFRDSNRVLNEFTYNALIRTLSRLPAINSWEEHYECCNQIDNIIEEMSQSVSPNAITRGFGINAWAACAMQAQDDESRVICAEKASIHMNELLSGSKFETEKSVMINAINDVITLYGKASQPMKAVEVFEAAKEKQLYNLQSLASIVDSLAKNSYMDISYADKAKQYLLEFEKDKMRMSPSLVFPDMKYTRMYNSVISGYLSCNKKDKGLAHAQTLLSYMIESHESNPRHIARPNTTSFVPVMSSLAYSDSPQVLEKLLSKMESLYQRRNSIQPHSPDAKLVANVEPNTTACNALLKAYARLGNRQSALQLLGRMEKDVNLSSARPDVHTHAIMSTLFSDESSGNTSSSDSLLGGQEVSSDFLNVDGINLKDLNLNGQDLKPTAKSFESMMNRTVEGAEKATELLRQLETMNASGEISFKRERLLHNYNNIINAWCECEKNGDNSTSASEKAESILSYLFEHETLSPNNASFGFCIKAWCKSNRPDAAERAEQILRRKELFAKEHSNVYIAASDYNQIIAKWRDDQVNGPDRARKLFKEMDQNYGNTAEVKSRPNIVTFNSLLDVLAKSKSRDLAEECEELLQQRDELFKEGKSSILPDIISYRSCIDAWIRQWQKDSPQRVEALVKDMIKKYSVEGRTDLRPDADLFNLVLKACAHATVTWHEDIEKEANDTPISIANRTFALLKGKNNFNAKPTHATYAFMFVAYKFHLNFDNSRYTPLLLMLWKQCCNDGVVSQFALESFRDCVLDYQFWKAIGGKERYAALGTMEPKMIKVEDLPQEWKRNVKPPRRRGKGAK
ncbi:hypothetical protein ACHAWT_005399 [Skeletonema menzelii]